MRLRLRFFWSSQLDYMVTGGTVHIALATATVAAAVTAMSQMNGFHTHTLQLRQRQNEIGKKNAVAVVRCERTFRALKHNYCGTQCKNQSCGPDQPKSILHLRCHKLGPKNSIASIKLVRCSNNLGQTWNIPLLFYFLVMYIWHL